MKIKGEQITQNKETTHLFTFVAL